MFLPEQLQCYTNIAYTFIPFFISASWIRWTTGSVCTILISYVQMNMENRDAWNYDIYQGYPLIGNFSLCPAPRPGRVMVMMCRSVCLCVCLSVLPPIIYIHQKFILWTMGELLNNGWYFEISVNFWIMGELLSNG